MNSLLQLYLLSNILQAIISFSYGLKSNLITNDITVDKDSIYHNLSYYIPTIELCFGTPNNQCFDMAISTTTVFILIEDAINTISCFNQTYSTGNSSSFTNTYTGIGINLFHLQTFLGEINKDYISFPKQDIFEAKHTFILLNGRVDFNIQIGGIIGMRKYYSSRSHFDGVEYSFIDYLYNKVKLISQPMFALRYDSDGSGRLYFDEDFGDYPKCTSKYVYKTYPYWNCDLTSLKLGQDNIKLERNTVIFDSFKSIITIPSRVGKEIMNKIVDASLAKCGIKSDGKYQFIICNRDISFAAFPDIILYMNDIQLVLKWKYLFKDTIYQHKNSYISMVAVDNFPREDDSDNWVIGIPGFIDNTIIFNHNEGQVGILPNGKVYYNKQSRLIIYLMLTIMSIAGIVLIIITKLIIKNN